MKKITQQQTQAILKALVEVNVPSQTYLAIAQLFEGLPECITKDDKTTEPVQTSK